MGGIRVSVGRGGLKFVGEGSWNVRGCGKPEDRGKIKMVSKKGWEWAVQGNGLKEKEPPHRWKLTQRSESFHR